MGFLKGKLAIKLFQEQKQLSKKYWGRHIWVRGYCVSSIGWMKKNKEIRKMATRKRTIRININN